jgi:membrane fusion protein, heavy metal efflux system
VYAFVRLFSSNDDQRESCMKTHCFDLWRGVPLRPFAATLSAATALAIAACAAQLAGQASNADAVTVQLHLITPHLIAYGQVEPIQLVPVDAAETGMVQNLRVVPGAHVRAGQLIAILSGPTMHTLLTEDQADVRSARSTLDAAQKSLAIGRQQLPSHLTTRQTVQQAESMEVQAQTTLDNTQSRLAAARQLTRLTAPTSGLVLAVNSANGQLVSAGQPVVTLQPAAGLWVRASYYGSALASIRLGMTGQFTPSDGSLPIAVRVCSLPGMLATGGGESVSLCPAHSGTAWLNGESGAVSLNLPRQDLVAIPTRALVLNQGKWWVMIHTAKGDHPQPVVPGPAQGWDTFIKSGLAPGAHVIVNNAYLLFHASIAEQFQIPD